MEGLLTHAASHSASISAICGKTHQFLDCCCACLRLVCAACSKGSRLQAACNFFLLQQTSVRQQTCLRNPDFCCSSQRLLSAASAAAKVCRICQQMWILQIHSFMCLCNIYLTNSILRSADREETTNNEETTSLPVDGLHQRIPAKFASARLAWSSCRCRACSSVPSAQSPRSSLHAQPSHKVSSITVCSQTDSFRLTAVKPYGQPQSQACCRK